MLHRFETIAVVGYAKTGKTRISVMFDRFVLHTDDYIGNENEIKPELAKHETFVVEGVRVYNLLRDGLDVDAVLMLTPKFECHPNHRAQRKACDTMWAQFVKKTNIRIIMLNEDIAGMFLELERGFISAF